MKRFVLALGVMALTGALLTTSALAKTNCNGTIMGKIITGGLTVTGGDCVLQGVIVKGGIKMESGTLFACGSSISGGVHVTGGTCVVLGLGQDDLPAGCAGDTITGGVDIENVDDSTHGGDAGAVCAAAKGNFEAENTSITGGVRLEDNGSIQLEGDTIVGGARIDDNYSAEVDKNSITGGLRCSGNGVVEDNSQPNSVIGGKYGQCAGF